MYYFLIAISIYWMLVCGFINQGKKLSALGTQSILFVAWLILALRGSNIGVDTKAYIDYFYRIQQTSLPDIMQGCLLGGDYMEIGFTLLVKSFGLVFSSPQWLLAFCGGVYLLAVNAFLKELKIYTPAYATLYLFLAPYLAAFNTTRQLLAVGLLMFAWMEIRKAKKKALIYILLAASCHISALIGFLFYVFGFERLESKILKRKTVLLTIICCLVFAFAGGPVFLWVLQFFPTYAQRYGISGRYTDMTTEAGFVVLLWLVVVGLAILIAMTTRWKTCKDVKKYEYILYSLLAVAFSFLGMDLGGAQRITLYFQPFWIPLIHEGEQRLQDFSGKLYIFVACIASIIFFILQSGTAQYSPYVFFWEG